MPYTKEQLKAYWQIHKDQLNQKRRQKRRLAKLGLAAQVSSTTAKVSHSLKMANPTANPKQVSHGKPINNKLLQKMANSQLTLLIQEWQTHTNYNCAPGCSANKYCSNCWYFTADKLIDYKAGLYD